MLYCLATSTLCYDQIIQANTFLVFPASNWRWAKESPHPSPLKGMFSQVTPSLAESQWWVSHSHPSVRAGVWGLPDQETLGRWHSGDTSIKRIKWHPYKPQDLWKILTFLMTRLQKANFARQISVFSQTFNSPPSYKNPNILFCFSTAFRLHNQRAARNMFYCAYKLCMKYLNIQSASGQVSGSFNALFINE